MKKTNIAIAIAPLLVVGCISTDLGTARATTAPADGGVNAERGTGSNLTRRDREARQGMEREELERIQRTAGSRESGSGR